MLQYNVNKCVFNKRMKSSVLSTTSRRLSGDEFQTDGPATEKARGPNVLSGHRVTTRSRRVADLICCLDETSQRLVDRDQLSTMVLGRAYNCVLWRQVCTRVVRVRRTSEDLSSRTATSIGLTCGYRRPHQQHHLTPVATYRLLLSGQMSEPVW